MVLSYEAFHCEHFGLCPFNIFPVQISSYRTMFVIYIQFYNLVILF